MTAIAEATVEPRATTTRSAGLLTLVASLASLSVTLMQSLVVPALPDLPVILQASPVLVSWTVTISLLTGCITTPILGYLGDNVSRRGMMILLMSLVVIGSLMAPLGGIWTMLPGRALQGFGTALIPIAMAEMRHSLPPKRIAGALALISAMLGIGGGLGIPIGGMLLTAFGWRSLFWFAAGIAAISVILIAIVVPPTVHEQDHEHHFDYGGAIMLSVGLSAILLAITRSSSWSVPIVLAGLAIMVAWGFYELRQKAPLVNLRTTVRRPVLLTNISGILLGVVMFTNLLLTNLELQNPVELGGFAWEPHLAGLAMLPSVAAMLIVAPLSARLSHHYSPRLVVTTGAAIATLGYVARLLAMPNGGFVVLWATVVAFGVGMGYSAMPMVIVRNVHRRETGSANAVNALMRSIGMALSSAVVAIVSASFGTNFDGRPMPTSFALTFTAILCVAFGIGSTLMALLANENNEEVFQ